MRFTARTGFCENCKTYRDYEEEGSELPEECKRRFLARTEVFCKRKPRREYKIIAEEEWK